MPLLPHQLRVVEERTEMIDRLQKLNAFIMTPTFDALDKVERHLLVQQQAAMGLYVTALQCRIAGFKPL